MWTYFLEDIEMYECKSNLGSLTHRHMANVIKKGSWEENIKAYDSWARSIFYRKAQVALLIKYNSTNLIRLTINKMRWI